MTILNANDVFGCQCYRKGQKERKEGKVLYRRYHNNLLIKKEITYRNIITATSVEMYIKEKKCTHIPAIQQSIRFSTSFFFFFW